MVILQIEIEFKTAVYFTFIQRHHTIARMNHATVELVTSSETETSLENSNIVILVISV